MSIDNIEDAKLLAQIKKLSIPERILMVEDIWDSIRASHEKLTVTEAQKKDLDHRYAEYKNKPQNSSTWSGIKRRIKSKL